MNKQVGKQFGEDNPSCVIPSINVSTLEHAERKYHTAFPVDGDQNIRVKRVTEDTWHTPGPRLTSVATGTGPFPSLAFTRKFALNEKYGKFAR